MLNVGDLYYDLISNWPKILKNAPLIRKENESLDLNYGRITCRVHYRRSISLRR